MTTLDTASAEAGQEFMRQLAAKANADAEFRRRLETDPAPIFSAVGLELAAGVRFVCTPATRETAAAVAARSSEREIHIPIVETTGELSDEELARLNGGGTLAGLGATLGWGAGFLILLIANNGNSERALSDANALVTDAWNQPGL